MSPDAKRYYTGGHRVMIGGVPTRLARKPAPTAKAMFTKTFPGKQPSLQNYTALPEQQDWLRRHASDLPKKRGGFA